MRRVLIWALLERERWWPQRWLWEARRRFSSPADSTSWVIDWSASCGSSGRAERLGRGYLGPVASVHLEMDLAMIRDHPWLGVGPGAFPVALTHYQTLPYTGGENPHNLYLEIAAEYGLAVAILASLAFLFCLARVALAGRRLPLAHATRTRRMGPGGSAGGMCGPQWRGPGLELPSHRAHQRGPAWPDRRREPASFDRAAAPPDVAHPDWRRIAGRWHSWRCRSHSLRFRRAGDAGRTALTAGNVAAPKRTWFAHGGSIHSASRPTTGSRGPDSAPATPRGVRGRRTDAVECPPRSQRPRPRGRDSADRRPLGAAAAAYRHAVELAPAAHLSYHAGLVEALASLGRSAESIYAYERAASLFTPERVLTSEARCLAPGDRYLLARMSRIAARLYEPVADSVRRQAATDVQSCSSGRMLGDLRHHGSPREDLARGRHREFLARLDGGGWSRAETYLLQPFRHPILEWTPTGPAGLGSLAQRRERSATVRYEVEIGDTDALTVRCARTVTRFTRMGGF